VERVFFIEPLAIIDRHETLSNSILVKLLAWYDPQTSCEHQGCTISEKRSFDCGSSCRVFHNGHYHQPTLFKPTSVNLTGFTSLKSVQCVSVAMTDSFKLELTYVVKRMVVTCITSPVTCLIGQLRPFTFLMQHICVIVQHNCAACKLGAKVSCL
jgi:hypothetical protein